MRKFASNFCLRGMIACGFGPLVMAILYGILYALGLVETVTVPEMCLGIVSLAALAFIASGLNALYQIERLPLMAAVSIHGLVLYVSYLITYLLNGWLHWGTAPIWTFTVIFVLGYLAIWAVIYTATKRKTQKLNALLQRHKQQKTT